MAEYPQNPPLKVQMRHIHFGSQITHLEESTKTNHPLNRTLVSFQGGNLTIGSSGSENSLIITNGANVLIGHSYNGGIGLCTIGTDANSSNNSVVVTGPGSLLAVYSTLSLGGSSGNSLNVNNGGQVQAPYEIDVNSPQSIGNYTLSISGSNSSLSTPTLIFGRQPGNSGSMSINGGTVTDQTATIGENTNGNSFVTISSGVWSNSTLLNIGNGGAGTLTINGGSVYGNEDTIGYNGSGAVTVNSGLWSNRILTVGFYGNATLTINGGILNNSVGVNLGNYYGFGNASVTVNNGFFNTPTIDVNRVGIINIGSNGIISVNEGITNLYNFSALTINYGSLGGNDSIASNALTTPSIAFGSGTGTLNFNQANLSVLTSSISGNGSINQLGNGTTILIGSNSYTGPTTVNSGVLLVDNTTGSGLGSGLLTVNSNGVVGGNGSIAASAVINGMLDPSRGSTNTMTLTFNTNVILGASATTMLDLLSAGSYDMIKVGGALNYGGIFDIALGNTNAPGTYQFFSTLTGGTNITSVGSFSTVELTGLFGTWFLTNSNGTWNYANASDSYKFTQTSGQFIVTAVPEPSSYALFGLSVLALMIVATHKRA